MKEEGKTCRTRGANSFSFQAFCKFLEKIINCIATDFKILKSLP